MVPILLTWKPRRSTEKNCHFVTVSGHKIIDVTYWQRSLPVEGREWHLFDFALSSVGGGIQLELDDKTIPLSGLQIDFDIEHWANP